MVCLMITSLTDLITAHNVELNWNLSTHATLIIRIIQIFSARELFLVTELFPRQQNNSIPSPVHENIYIWLKKSWEDSDY